MDTFNSIDIWSPRWSTREVLIADWKIGDRNKITISAKRADGSLFYPLPFEARGAFLKSWPITDKRMRVVPLDALRTKLDEYDKQENDISKCHNAILLKDGRCPICVMREEER